MVWNIIKKIKKTEIDKENIEYNYEALINACYKAKDNQDQNGVKIKIG